MPGPGEYRPDATEGITRIDDLPKPNVSLRSRNYRRRPCPRCQHSSYRDSRGRRTLHDLGDPLTGRPRDLVVLYSRHFCSKCRRYFNADMTDLADPGSHCTRRVIDAAVRLVVEDGLPYRRAGWALWRDHRAFDHPPCDRHQDEHEAQEPEARAQEQIEDHHRHRQSDEADAGGGERHRCLPPEPGRVTDGRRVEREHGPERDQRVEDERDLDEAEGVVVLLVHPVSEWFERPLIEVAAGPRTAAAEADVLDHVASLSRLHVFLARRAAMASGFPFLEERFETKQIVVHLLLGIASQQMRHGVADRASRRVVRKPDVEACSTAISSRTTCS